MLTNFFFLDLFYNSDILFLFLIDDPCELRRKYDHVESFK